MTSHRLRLAPLLLATAWLCGGAGTTPADRLHLQSGGVIETDSWWIEGDELLYESDAGTVGIPRSVVTHVETSGGANEASAAPTDPPAALPARPQRPATGNSIGNGLQARARQAAEALEQRDYETAAMLFGDLLHERPEAQNVRLGYALAQLALEQDVLAAGAVLDGLALEPQHPALLELLGDLRNREERVTDALQSWRLAFDVAPNDRLRDKIVKAERELHAGRDYAFSASSHFNVRFDGKADMELARSVIEFLEERYWVMVDELRHSPAQPITVLLYPTKQFRDVTQAPEGVAGLYDGKIRVPLGGLSAVDERAARVLAHELAHAFVHSKTRGHCPRWLHEGLAQIAEGRRASQADRRVVLDRLRAGAPEKWESFGFSYPIALSLTRFLESRRGWSGLVDLLELLGEGRQLDEALTSVFGEDYRALCRRWGRQAAEDTQ